MDLQTLGTTPVYIDMLPKRDEFYSGICLKNTPELFLMVTIDDDMGCYDGITMVKTAEIGNIRPLDEEELAAIEINNWQKVASGIAVGSFQTVSDFFKWVKKSGKLISIFTSGYHDKYFVGKIQEVLKGAIEVRLIDEMGKWLNVEIMDFNSIDSVSFDSYYERELVEKMDSQGNPKVTKTPRQKK